MHHVHSAAWNLNLLFFCCFSVNLKCLCLYQMLIIHYVLPSCYTILLSKISSFCWLRKIDIFPEVSTSQKVLALCDQPLIWGIWQVEDIPVGLSPSYYPEHIALLFLSIGHMLSHIHTLYESRGFFRLYKTLCHSYQHVKAYEDTSLTDICCWIMAPKNITGRNITIIMMVRKEDGTTGMKQ